MTPAELACIAGVKREELEAIEAGRPYPGRRRARRRSSRRSNVSPADSTRHRGS
jgi:hypothetical protein